MKHTHFTDCRQMGSSEEIIPVVNEQDEIIGYKKRADITTDDIYRVT